MKPFKKWGWILLAIAGCQGSSTSDTPPTPPTAGGDEVRPVYVGSETTAQVVTSAALDWRGDRGAFVAGHATHRATVAPSGALEVTPMSFDATGRHENPTVTLQTTSVSVDGAPYELGVSRVEEHGATLGLVRGKVVEEIENVPEGVEQRWRFDSAPNFEGDLVVDVAVDGESYLSTTDGGLHFRGANGVGVRYSHATWRTADGKDYPIRAEYADGRIRMTVSSELVAATEFPAVLDPTITAEQQLDNPITATTGANATTPAIAFDGTNYLVVWADNRDSTDEDIWGTRVSQAGAILDPLGIKIFAGPGKQLHPTVAFTGAEYVVAFEDFLVTGGTNADIKASRVTTAGAVTQINNATFGNVAGSDTTPHLAGGGGGQALLVWNAAGDIKGSLITCGGGSCAADPGVGIAATAANEVDPNVAANFAGLYLVVWSEGAAGTADLRGQLVNAQTLAAVGPAFAVSAGAGAQLNPSAAFDGTNFVVTFTNNNAGINIFGTRINTSGMVLDTHMEGTTVVGGTSVSSAADNQEVSQVACTTGGCVVVWQDRRNLATTGFDIRAQRMTSAFALNGAELVVTQAGLNQNAPQVVSTGTAFFSVWQDLQSGNASNIFGTTISAAGAVGTPGNLVTGNNRETGPSIGRAQSIFGIFYSDSRNDGDIAVIRFNANGSKLDATSRLVSTAAFAQFNPAASTDLAGNYYVVWSDTRGGTTKDIFGSRVSSAGTALDLSGTSISAAAGNQLLPDVASNGTVALVVWQDGRAGQTDIFGALINSAGAVQVADIPISTATGNQTGPTVTFDAVSGQFIVVWADGRTGVNNIFGTRVSTAGVVLDTNGVQISSSPVGAFTPHVAASGTNSFVVWDDRRNATRDIFGSRITTGAALTVLDAAGIGVSTAAGNQTNPRVASIGTSYIVVWQDDRSGNLDIFGQQVALGGSLSGANFVVSNAPEDERLPQITSSTASGNARIVYEKQRLDIDTTRVVTRTISESAPTGQACSNDGQCSTGFCRDGKCCNADCGGANNLTDCQACSASKTGGTDGVCAPIAAGTVCRNYANTFCDLREVCDGVGTACPPDIGRNQGLVCNSATGTVCPANGAAGAPHVCP